MKLLLYILVLVPGLFILPGGKDGKYIVSGTVTHSGSYCGGASPTWEMEAEAARSKPYSGKWLYIKPGDTNLMETPFIDSVMTDEEGRFSVKLPPGEYCMVAAEQRNRDIFNRYTDPRGYLRADSACMETWWGKCLQQFTVTESELNGVDIHFYHPCYVPPGIPCLHYHGPIPP